MTSKPVFRQRLVGRFARLRMLAKRRLPARLLAHRRRKQAAAIAAQRPLPSRRERHLARLAERDAQLEEARAKLAATKPEFEA